MEVFVDVWEAQVDELGKVLRLITAGGDPSKSKSDNCVAIPKVRIDFRDDDDDDDDDSLYFKTMSIKAT